jgi:hypothetical protein
MDEKPEILYKGSCYPVDEDGNLLPRPATFDISEIYPGEIMAIYATPSMAYAIAYAFREDSPVSPYFFIDNEGKEQVVIFCKDANGFMTDVETKQHFLYTLNSNCFEPCGNDYSAHEWITDQPIKPIVTQTVTLQDLEDNNIVVIALSYVGPMDIPELKPQNLHEFSKTYKDIFALIEKYLLCGRIFVLKNGEFVEGTKENIPSHVIEHAEILDSNSNLRT